MKKLEGYVKKWKEDWVLKFNKALYAYQLAPKAWYSKLVQSLSHLEFLKSLNDWGVYVKQSEGERLIIQEYSDDLIITRSNSSLKCILKKR